MEDVKGYYREQLAQLKSEIQTKGKGISPMEQFLLDKFNAEIGYCNIALLKAGIGAAEELKGLVEIGKEHMKKVFSYLSLLLSFLFYPNEKKFARDVKKLRKINVMIHFLLIF